MLKFQTNGGINMKRSRGFRNKTRHILKKAKKRITITEKLKTFKIGDGVLIMLDASKQSGMPHPRYHGTYGKISEIRGKGYMVDIKDKNMPKQLLSAVEHLRKA